MSASIPRYLIENHGPCNDATKTAFAGAFQVCAKSGIASISLLVSARGAFPSSVLGRFQGDIGKEGAPNG